jgi:hypothetical protein
MVSIMFYAATAMLFFGAFIARYRMELVLAFAFVAPVMAVYLYLSYSLAARCRTPRSSIEARG